jgi:hypothetical protein
MFGNDWLLNDDGTYDSYEERMLKLQKENAKKNAIKAAELLTRSGFKDFYLDFDTNQINFYE